ncbi:amidase signature domain-containing protein [Aspergillus karnatakaensis]|uniref:amidase signature domain-containing protein n=1 Tax=Aspergillus karnatakaensis TaxID=1810916 RepID=UPI003CCDD3F2
MSSISNPDQPSWQTIAAKKRAEVAAKIPSQWRLPSHYTDKVEETSNWNVLNVPRECGVLSARELEITESYDAVALVDAIALEIYTAEEVAIAFCKRAAIAQQLTRCCTEIIFDEAIATAKDLDTYFRLHGRVKGPLHGLPISVKDGFNIKGYDSTSGYVSFIGRKAEANAPLVDILLESGAVIHVKTNIPLTLMTADSHNNIYGRVLNPHNISLTAGGSSGGEGALVAMRGSLLGIGTDIAGSIRIPALCCGTYGFKPSIGRIPSAGQAQTSRAGSPGFPACTGPLATSLRSTQLLMQTVLAAQPWNRDPGVIPVEWRTTQTRRSLTIAVIGEDTNYPFHPPVRRVLNEAVAALQKAGHRIKTLDTPSIYDASMLAFKLFTLDSTLTPLRHIEASGEPPIPSMKTSLPDFGTMQPPTLDDLWGWNAQKAEFTAQWHQIWVENDLDAIIMPGHNKTASPHDTYGYPPYTVVWNLVDWPACIIPYGKVDPSLDAVDGHDPGIYANAPCALQIVGRRFQDEHLSAVAEIINADLARK